MKPQRSKIAWGEVGHFRATPKQYGFSYPLFTFELDLDELESSSFWPLFFSYNRRALLSVRSSDYLGGDGSLREKVERLLSVHGVSERPYRITLMTMPRFCGYIFNPVSFFACFDRDGRVLGLITQVNNTFGESHVYPLVCQPSEIPVTWRFTKEFFVSPFFDREGEYTVVLEAEGEKLGVLVELEREGVKAFSAYLRGAAQELTPGCIVRTLVRFPLASLLTMTRIHLHALVLHFKVGLTPYLKPAPRSSYTFHSKQNLIHRARLWLLARFRSRQGERAGPRG
jgi:cyclopropane-fatty-acyl-phospholipid synthase